MGIKISNQVRILLAWDEEMFAKGGKKGLFSTLSNHTVEWLLTLRTEELVSDEVPALILSPGSRIFNDYLLLQIQ